MQNYEQKLGNEGYGAYGRGHFIRELPQTQRLAFNDFSGGLDMRDSKEDTPLNSSPDALDVEVTDRNRLRPVPGTTTLETLSRNPEQMVLQASLDYTSELIMFDAPFIGVKTGAVTVWADKGLPVADRPYASVNFGGTLIFSNGRTGLFMRESGKDEVELIEHGPAAHTLASFAGRIFAGASIIGGNREPLGISWSAATSDPKDWDTYNEDGAQTGAGSELLIDDMIQGNYVVALRTMGLDFLAVFMRNSIWIGRRTSQLLRPADFQPRVTGVGAISEPLCVVTRFGAVHVHDSGVYLFDGNNTVLISEQINSELLPIDRTQLNLYRSTYNPVTKLYFLFTPVCTWVFDLERRRWHKRSLIARGASVFASQVPAKMWSEMTGTWGEQTGDWEDYKAEELNDVSFLFLGDENTNGVLAKEDPASRMNFGEPLDPYWELPFKTGAFSGQLVSCMAVEVEYTGGGRLDVRLPDQDGNLTFVHNVPLRERIIGSYTSQLRHTGRGVGARLHFPYGNCEVEKVGLLVLPRSRRRETAPQLVLLLTDSGLSSGIFTDFSNYSLGTAPDFVIPAGSGILTANIVDAGVNGKDLRFQADVTGSSGAIFSKCYWNVPISVGLQEIDVVCRLKFDNSFHTKRAPLLRATTVLGQDVAVGLDLTAPRTAGLTRSGSFGLEASTPFAWTGEVYYWMRLHASAGSHNYQMKVWVGDADDEPGAFMVSSILSAVTVGSFVGFGLQYGNGTHWVQVDRIGIGLNGTVAPKEPVLEGWVVMPGKFNLRISDLPSDLHLRIADVEYEHENGVIVLNLATAPDSIEFLNMDDSVFGTFTGVLQSGKSYSFSYNYE